MVDCIAMKNLAGSVESCFFLFIRYNELESPLKKEADILLAKIKTAMETKVELCGFIENSYNEIFRLRMLAIKAIVDDGNSLQGLIQDSFSFFEEMISDEKLSNLGENILFAIRSNSRIANQIFSGSDISASISGTQYSITETDIFNIAQQLQGIEFTQLINLIRVNVPDGMSSPIAEWLEVSLKMEFAILAGAMLKESRIAASDEKIEELSFLLIDATHTYNAIAIEEGFIKLDSIHKIKDVKIFEDESNFVHEQQKLADMDLKSFSENWE